MRILDAVLFQLLTRPRILGEVKVSVPRAEELRRKYVEGLSRALGIAPNEIREDVVERWLIHWLRAIIKPEYWQKYGLV